MSDQPQDSANNSVAESGEPSMEDILASIRRIIAEDEEQSQDALDSFNAATADSEDTDVLAEAVDAGDDVDDLSVILEDAETDFSDADLVIPDIEVETVAPDLDLVSLPTERSENPSAADQSEIIELVVSTEDTTASMDVEDSGSIFDDLDLLVSEEDLEPATPETDLDEALDLAVTEVIEPSAEITEELGTTEADDDELDLVSELLNEEFEKTESVDQAKSTDEHLFEPSVVMDEMDDEPPVVEFEPVNDIPDAPLPSAADDTDIDLVKSLMADLTDSSFLEDDEPSDDVEATDTSEASPDGILDEILEMSIEDETSMTDPLEPQIGSPNYAVETPSEPGFNPLLQIAAAAEADADQMMRQLHSEETDDIEPGSEMATDALDVIDEADIEDIIELETIVEEPIVDLDEALEPVAAEMVEADMKEEGTPMPTAKAKDTILDEVTETAAASAFAELNQAVEQQVEEMDSGPAIGDLVQEALKPMLKEWLDKNLKGIVERAVQKEVKRISSGK